MRLSVMGTQPIPGWTPFAAPSQFSQYPWRTFPAGREFTAHVSADTAPCARAGTSSGTASTAAKRVPNKRVLRPDLPAPIVVEGDRGVSAQDRCRREPLTTYDRVV